MEEVLSLIDMFSRYVFHNNYISNRVQFYKSLASKISKLCNDSVYFSTYPAFAPLSGRFPSQIMPRAYIAHINRFIQPQKNLLKDQLCRFLPTRLFTASASYTSE